MLANGYREINLFDECLEILYNKCLKTQNSTNLLSQ